MASPEIPPWASTAVAPNFNPYFTQLSDSRNESLRDEENDEEASTTKSSNHLSSSEATFRRRGQPVPPHNDDVSTKNKRCPKAKNQRRRHVPVGPAGVWFESQLHQKAKQQQQQQQQQSATNADDNNHLPPDSSLHNNPATATTAIAAASSSSSPSSSTSIKDVSSCPAWQRMQAALGIMTPTVSHCENVAERYHWLRPHIPSDMVLLPELLFQDGKFDLRVTAPHSMIVLVHAVHSHSQHPYDWTVELIDETACTIRAWMEPRFVQKEQEGKNYESSTSNGSLIRPGVCWQLQNVSMTIQEHDNIESSSSGMETVATTTSTWNTSNVHMGVERILLVAEHNIIQSWGPGTASSNRNQHTADDDDNDNDDGINSNDHQSRRRHRSIHQRERQEEQCVTPAVDDRDGEDVNDPVEPIIRSFHHSQRPLPPPQLVAPEPRPLPVSPPKRDKRRRAKEDRQNPATRQYDVLEEEEPIYQPSASRQQQPHPHQSNTSHSAPVPDFSQFLSPSQAINSPKHVAPPVSNNYNKSSLTLTSVAVDEVADNSAKNTTQSTKKSIITSNQKDRRQKTPRVNKERVTVTAPQTITTPGWLDECAIQNESLWDLEEDDDDGKEDDSAAQREHSQQVSPNPTEELVGDECGHHGNDGNGDDDEMLSQEEGTTAVQGTAIRTHSPATRTTASSLFDVTAMEDINVDELFQVDDDDDDD